MNVGSEANIGEGIVVTVLDVEPRIAGRTGIDIAVGILMVRCGQDRGAASRELIRRARTSARGLGATAADIIAEAERAAIH